jgi:hypothetical protein
MFGKDDWLKNARNIMNCNVKGREDRMKCHVVKIDCWLACLQVQKYISEHLETLIQRAAEQISGNLHIQT